MRPIAVIAICAMAFSSGAFAEQGLHPRPTSTDYPAHQDSKALAVGAALVRSQAVKKAFSPDINKTYVVVETGIYPGGTGALKVATADFALKIGEDLVHAAGASTVAASLDRDHDRDPSASQNPSQISGRVHGTVGASVGYENGTNPVTGQRVHGWTRSVGVDATDDPATGMPSPNPPPKPSPRNIQADIEDRALPEGDAIRPVAGYLYFPVSAKARKNAELTLVYLGSDDPVAVPLTKPTASADTR